MLRDFSPTEPLASAFRDRVNDEILGFLKSQEPLMEAVGTSQLLTVGREYAGGGKRLRPAFCVWAYDAAGGDPAHQDALLKAASSLDVLHISALVHDDLIDDADTRRGEPSAHRQYEALHTARGGRGSQHMFGASAAILLGDMLLMWSAEMFDTCAHPNIDLARNDLSRMRMEVTAGQFLDISAAFDVADSDDALQVARTVLEYKSASYSMRRPALIGAKLANCDDDVYEALASFGSHIGAAFQLRDDILGIWGDADVTGKPQGGDLIEGKATVLVLTALDSADDQQAAELREVLGNKDADEAAIVRAAQLIEATGARDAVETLIDEHLEQGLAALDQATLTDSGRTALTRLAELSVRRAF